MRLKWTYFAALVFAALALGPALAHQATRNWTVTPADWLDLRTRREYGHAGSAVFNLIAVVALVLPVLKRAGRPGGRGPRAH